MVTVEVSDRHCGWIRTVVLGGALSVLTADILRDGWVTTAESTHCRGPGPAPLWARAASRANERQSLAAVGLLIAVNRYRNDDPVLPPAVRLLGGVAARAMFAKLVRRPRPPESWWRSEPHGWSFPSRHTTHALLMSGLLLDEAPEVAPAARAAVVAITTGVVGASRVRLGVHWPSDVLGGALAGALWLHLTRPSPNESSAVSRARADKRQ